MSTHPRQGRRALLGGLIVLALVALGTGIFVLDDVVARFRSSYTVIAVLGEAPRLAPGSRVWVGGHDVGEVTSISLIPGRDPDDTRVVATLRLPGRVRPQVRHDSEVRITALNLMGAPVLDIVPGSAAAAALAAGDTVFQVSRIDSEVIRARARTLRLALDSAFLELNALQPAIRQRLAGLEQVQRQLAGAQLEYAQLRSALSASPLLAAGQRGELAAVLQRSGHTVSALLALLEEGQRRAAASGLAERSAALAARAGELRQSLAELQLSMQERGGTLDRLARDSALVRALGLARAELDSLIADARRNPTRYVF